jgi:Ribosomal protein S1
MEVYKDLSTDSVKEFENLLNSQMSKVKIEEGKIIHGTVTKISEKFVFLFVEGLKSEPVLDINEIKGLNLFDKLKVGSKLPVLLEKIEDKNGEVIVSATKAQKIKGWQELEKAFEKMNL